jgi:hypothetical protein
MAFWVSGKRERLGEIKYLHLKLKSMRIMKCYSQNIVDGFSD